MFSETHFHCRDLRLCISESASHGPPLLLIHGISRGWRDFGTVMPALAARYRLLAVDLRGHGGSAHDAAGRYAVADFVDDIVQLVAAKFDRPGAVWGHSLGALIAASVAAHPALAGQIQCAILEDPPSDLLGQRSQQSRYRPLFTAWRQWAGESLSAAQWVQRLSTQPAWVPGRAEPVPLGQIRDAAAIRFLAACLARVDARVFDALLAGQWPTIDDLGRTLASIPCPWLVLHGSPARGGMCGPDDAQRLAQQAPQGDWVVLPDQGHQLHYGAAETCLRLATTFLDAVDLDNPPPD